MREKKSEGTPSTDDPLLSSLSLTFTHHVKRQYTEPRERREGERKRERGSGERGSGEKSFVDTKCPSTEAHEPLRGLG